MSAMAKTQWSRHTLTGEVLSERLVWLIRLRWLAVAGMLALTAIARWVLDVRVGAWEIFALAALVAGYNGLLLVWLRRLGRAAGLEPVEAGPVRHMVNAQIAMDLLVLVLVLHFAGGVTNPVAIFMVFHMAIAAILLPRRDAYLQAAWASVLYLGMAVGEMAVPALHRPMHGYPATEAVTPNGTGLHAAPLYVAGQCLMIVVALWLIAYFTSDISARLRRAYRHLARAADQLSDLEFAKSRFLRVAAHQLRGPLAAIYSVLQAVEADGGNLSEQQKRLLGRVQSRSKDMMELLNEMLTLSQVKESRPAEQQRSTVSLAGVLKAIVDLHATAAQEKGVALKLTVTDDAQVSAWDKALDDVFGNLVSNAVKYTPAGGLAEVVCRRQGPRAVVTVRDTGIGIPADSQRNLFSEFFRAGNAKKFAGGTGLGLSIVKEIVERLGGQITFSSVEGQGTTFTVELPAA